MSTEDEHAIQMVNEYLIPGWKFLVHRSGQTSLGKRTVSASFSTARTITSDTVVTNHGNLVLGANRLITPEIPVAAIKHAAWEVRKELLRWATDVDTNILLCPLTGQPLHFLSGVSYDFDSEGGVNINASLEYVQAKAGGRAQTLWQ